MHESQARGPNVRPWAIAGAVVVVAGIVVALVTGGGKVSGSDSSLDSVSRPIVSVSRANILDSARIFTAGVREENISDFVDLYQGHFEQTMAGATCTSAQQPMNVDAALAEWQCIFDRARAPRMQLRDERVDLTTRTMTAGYRLTDRGEALRSGTIRFHFIPGQDFPRMDRVVFK